MFLAVVGGELLSSALDAVVAVLGADGSPRCSGVLIGSRHVLTAAHCAAEASGVAWGVDLVDREPVAARGLASVELAEGWEEGDRASDLALLALEADAPARPWPLGAEPPEPGAPLWIYGFGVAAEVGDLPGRKRGAELELLEADAGTLLSWSPSANACSGDSGGPAVVRVGDGWAVVGVQTWVEPACLGGKAGTTRADAWEGWLSEAVPDLSREPIPGPAAAPPAGCAHLSGPGGLLPALVAAGAARLSRAGRRSSPGRSGRGPG